MNNLAADYERYLTKRFDGGNFGSFEKKYLMKIYYST